MKFGGFAAQSGQNSDTLFPHPGAHASCCLRHQTHTAAVPPIGHAGAAETAESAPPSGWSGPPLFSFGWRRGGKHRRGRRGERETMRKTKEHFVQPTKPVLSAYEYLWTN